MMSPTTTNPVAIPTRAAMVSVAADSREATVREALEPVLGKPALDVRHWGVAAVVIDSRLLRQTTTAPNCGE